MKITFDTAVLKELEENLDTKYPLKSELVKNILGYGEISVVLELEGEKNRGVAFKRLSMFKNIIETYRYESIHKKYLQMLGKHIGINVIPCTTITLATYNKGYIPFYIIQKKLQRECLANCVIRNLNAPTAKKLFHIILTNIKKVFDFNRRQKGELEIGFDGQISNWGITGLNPSRPVINNSTRLVYFDTSAPFIRVKGKEQLESEWYLRSAPSYMLWIVRLLFVDEVMNRYYDLREVVKDLLGNLYKEKRPDLLPDLTALANEFFNKEIKETGYAPITEKEIKDYYRRDAFIWSFYLNLRRIDRFIKRSTGREYPYVLPGKIKR